MEQNVPSRGSKLAPSAAISHGDALIQGGGGPPPGHEELKALVQGYKGFGILSLIRAFVSHGGFRSFMLSSIGIILLLGQWIGPVGFIAFKFTTEDMAFCPGHASNWARCVMASVAMIYFARLSLASLSHRHKLPEEFGQYKIPEWWGIYRYADLVVTSLVYNTFIFLANLLLVFQGRDVPDMVFNVLALEFFTAIDDRFKAAVLEYDSTFLDSMLLEAATPEESAYLQDGQFISHSPSLIPSNHPRALTVEATSEPQDIEEAKGRNMSAGTNKDSKTCCGRGEEAVLAPVKGVLLIARAVCRIAGPLFAFVAIFYGPCCLGTPEA